MWKYTQTKCRSSWSKYELNSDLERAISSVLESMFGSGKVVVKVNSDLNFDTNEITEIKIDPNKVAIKENKK